MSVKSILIVLIVITLSNITLSAQGFFCLPFFASSANYTLNGAQRDIVAADFNEDGNLDLATVSPSANCVSLLYGTASGVFTSITNFTSNVLTPHQIKSADFNGDGHADLVLTNTDQYLQTNTFGNQVTIMLGTGTGNFSAAINFTVANNTFGIAAEDFNSDSKIDLLLSNGIDLKLLLGNGTGSFSATITFTSTGSPQCIISKDFNGDGKSDVAVCTQGADVMILLGTGAGSFNYASSISTSILNSTNVIVISDDFDNDGKWDLVVGMVPTSTMTPSTKFKLYLGSGSGTFSAASINFFATGNSFVSDIATGDLNSDGKKDILITFVNGVFPLVLTNTGNGNFVSGPPIYVLQDPRGIAIGDFNLDGKEDVAIAKGDAPITFEATVYLNTTSFPVLTVTSSSSLICSGESVNLTASGAYSYTWSTGQDSSVVIASPVSTTSYTLRGSNASGCASSFTFQQIVQECTGIYNKSRDFDTIKLYPNPSSDKVCVSSTLSFSQTKLLNYLGDIISDEKSNAEKSKILDVSKLTAGVYYLQLYSDGKLMCQQKVVIVD